MSNPTAPDAPAPKPAPTPEPEPVVKPVKMPDVPTNPAKKK